MVRLGRRGFVGGAVALSAALWMPRPGRAASAMGFDVARHLLSRTAFGATPAEVEALASMDFPAAIERLLATGHPKTATPAPGWVDETLSALRELRRKARAAAGKTQDGKPVNEAARLVRAHGQELRSWWIGEMLATNQPLVEKMTLFWHNHFTSSIQKVRYVPALYRQNVLFRREALGNFATLLKAVARDPAMLIYLDGVRNMARQPNENFARELLELFTLGEGHYSEADIKSAARAFTGWSIDRDSGQFVDRMQLHDDGEKTFLGQSGHFTGDDILAILLRHPRTAETIVEKLWREFVSFTPGPAEVKHLAAVFRGNNYEMKPLLRALFLSPAFRDPANRGALIKSPVELIVGTVHVFGLPVPDPTPLVRMTAGLGQALFAPPNVKGWPGGESWITTSTLLLRQQFLRRLIEATTVSSLDGNMAMARRGRRADRIQQMPEATMESYPVEGRSLRGASGEAQLGPTLTGVDKGTLLRALLPRKPIDAAAVEAGSPGAVVAAALLDPAYQLK
ncbi:MAG: putative SIGNAL PEPTIDE PROTEIN [Enhydrobacter sp.]|nr:MAG: putative SIGNAL PEPTIDE PROTEIN [Enhydrobacter sp.]